MRQKTNRAGKWALMLLSCIVALCLLVTGAFSFPSFAEEESTEEFTSISDFDNSDVIIGVVDGFIFGNVAAEKLPNAKIVYYPDREAAFRALTYGEVDGVVDDDAIIRSILRSTENMYMVDGYIENSDYSFIFTKNDKGEKLSESFSEYIKSLKEDGTLAGLDEKWFGSNKNNKKSEDIPAYSADSDTQNIVLALSDDGSIPFSYLSAGRPVGYDIDVIIGFCKANGYSATVKMTDFEDMQKGVEEGRYDLGCGGITVTEERKEKLIFCEPDYSGGIAICALKSKYAQEGGAAPGRTGSSRRQDWEASREGWFAGFLRHVKYTFIDGDRYRLFTRGILVTVTVSITSIIIGSLLGFVLYKEKKRGRLTGKAVSGILLWLVQGVPAIMLIMILYYTFFRNMAEGSILASIAGLTFAFAEMCCRDIDKNSRCINEGKLADDYRLEYLDDLHFVKALFNENGKRALEDYRDDIILIIKMSSVIGYVSAQDMVKVFDTIRMESLETMIPLIATTLVYMFIIKIVTSVLGHFILCGNTASDDMDDFDDSDDFDDIDSEDDEYVDGDDYDEDDIDDGDYDDDDIDDEDYDDDDIDDEDYVEEDIDEDEYNDDDDDYLDNEDEDDE